MNAFMMNRWIKYINLGLILLFVWVSCVTNKKEEKRESAHELLESTYIDDVWAANRVRFALQTAGDMQYVAYYNRNRMMSVASRKLGSDKWEKVVLNNKLRWDSHNYVVLAVDKKGYIHVSGNMHVDPLIYYRSTRPYDISSLAKVKNMVGVHEEDVTYPKFFYSDDNELFFSYRSGTCGNGVILINKFNTDNLEWERYSDQPLFDGIEKNDDRAAYHRFIRDDQGYFHYTWIWRWTPEVATSHQICYAKSADLLHWENAKGENIDLPFKPDDQRVIVDPTPSEGGMTNARFGITLTPDNQPIIGYVKYDDNGFTQLYLARFIDGIWIQSQISDWDFRWEFIGGGDRMTIGGQFDFRGFSEEGLLVIDYETETGDSGSYVVNPLTLERLEKDVDVAPKYPEKVWEKMSDNEVLQVRIVPEVNLKKHSEKYLLKWESMPPSHGRHAPEVIPSGPISELRILKIDR